MRESTRQSFKAILKEDNYSWDEFSDVLIKNIKKTDMEELIYFLQEKNGKMKK
jgi:hypothetical protein